MQLSNLNPNVDNPRKITDKKLKELKKALDEFGDLGGIVFNRRTQRIVGGHQRQRVLPANAEIKIEFENTEASKSGTVAGGYVKVADETFSYREVDWDEVKEKAANIAANKGAGEWDMEKLGDWFKDLDDMNFDLDLTMFDEDERKQFLPEPEVQDDPIPEEEEVEIYEGDPRVTLINNDCLIHLKSMDSISCDALVTDPPAGISFMGKEWDDDKGGRDYWVTWFSEVMQECLRVLKPGAHGLIWALPRTSHWTATALENAGFEIRDICVHLYGSGFPKSLDISQAIDKQAGAAQSRGSRFNVAGQNVKLNSNKELRSDYPGYVPPKYITNEAKKWDGFGTAIKPAHEHWILVRRPLSEDTIAENVLKHGTGGLNIDECRIEGLFKSGWSESGSKESSNTSMSGKNYEREPKPDNPEGRFPANLILSHHEECEELQCHEDCAVQGLDEHSGTTRGGGKTKVHTETTQMFGMKGHVNIDYPDSGGASRFFYVSKASESDKGSNNNHPTVKSTKLMEYLIKLVTPPQGKILDPFMGSGSTGVAAKQWGFEFIGIEKEKEYFDIASKRIYTQSGSEKRI